SPHRQARWRSARACHRSPQPVRRQPQNRTDHLASRGAQSLTHIRQRRHLMYAITGISGKVGGALADALLNAGLPVRAVVRDAAKGEVWKARGCDVAIAQMEDSEALAKAFAGAEA